MSDILYNELPIKNEPLAPNDEGIIIDSADGNKVKRILGEHLRGPRGFTGQQGVPGQNGNDGRDTEFRIFGGYMQSRPVGGTWTNLIAVSDLQGDPGRNLELRKNATHIQYRLEGDTVWKDLVPLTDIQGPALTLTSFVRTSGNGQPGTTDVYTGTFSNNNTFSFSVYQGKDGTGTGDMTKAVYDTDDDGVVDTANEAKKIKTIAVTVTTPATTVAKVGTTASGNYVPQAGDELLVTFNLGSTSNGVTLNIDGSGAKQVKIGYSNTTSATLNLAANQPGTIRMWYDGNFYQIYGATANHTYTEISETEINNASSTTARLISGRRIWNWITSLFSQNVETDKESTAKFPSVKAIHDWTTGKLDGKANLAGGNVFSGEQEMGVIKAGGTYALNNKEKLTFGYVNQGTSGYDRYFDIIANANQGGGVGGSNIRFFTNSQSNPDSEERMIITRSGNVGIGTANPAEKLEVNGNIKIKESYVKGDNIRFEARMTHNRLLFYDIEQNKTMEFGYSSGSGDFNIFAIHAPNGKHLRFRTGGNLYIIGIPTSATGLSSGAVWRDGTTLRIVP